MPVIPIQDGSIVSEEETYDLIIIQEEWQQEGLYMAF